MAIHIDRSAATHTIPRRDFLRLAAAGASLAAVGGLLQACGGTAGPASSGPASAGAGSAPASAAAGGPLKMPAYIPFPGPKPDLPGTPDGVVPPAYLTYPSNLVKSVAQPAGKGEDVTAMVYTINAAPTPVEQNAAWQQVNKDLGVNLKIPIINLADYPAKFATTMAGGQIPDILGLAPGAAPFPGMPDFLQQQCTDLTPFLGGDAIKDYPNLANLPPYAWPVAIYNQKIYGVPVARAGLSANVMLGKKKDTDAIGVTKITNTDDFTKMMKDLTKPGQHWGVGIQAVAAPVGWFQGLFGAPNNWGIVNGKLTKDWETDEYKATVAYVRGLWDAGVVFPDSPTLTSNSLTSNWLAGKYTFWLGGYLVYLSTMDRAVGTDPSFQPFTIAPFSHDGKGKATYPLGNGASGLMMLKKATPDRTKQLLGVLNYLAAPFGTQEALLLEYGVKDTDYKLDPKGNPILTDRGILDTYVPFRSIATKPDVILDANSQDLTKNGYQVASENFGIGIHSATLGLYSNTDAQKGAIINQKVTDGVQGIIFGRADVSSLDQLVKDWRASGGDIIRGEYEQALAAGKK